MLSVGSSLEVASRDCMYSFLNFKEFCVLPTECIYVSHYDHKEN
jgi:hypothetical protein